MYAQDNNEVFAWLRGGDSTPDPEMENRFLDIIAERVMVKMGVKLSDEEAARRAEAERRRQRRSRMTESPISIKTIMRQIREEEAQAQPALPSEESLPWENEAKPAAVPDSLDSVLVAKALQWMASTHEVSLNISQIQTILYNAYGVYLATKGERLLSEHPQVWQYGPVFPRAYNRLRKEAGDGFEEYDSLRNEHPSVFKYLTNCFRRYAWTKACILVSPHVADGSPWADTRKSNPDSWGARIEDDLIREWFLPRV